MAPLVNFTRVKLTVRSKPDRWWAIPEATLSAALARPCTAFAGNTVVSAGPLIDVALAVKARIAAAGSEPVLVFDDATGAVIDLDLRGDAAEIASRLTGMFDRIQSDAPQRRRPGKPAATDGRGRGRPRLGVVAREVTLLPRQWEWLASQPGGASQALRRLVDEARRQGAGQDRIRPAREAAYRFMAAMAGNLPGFEEATRALFAGDRARFEAQIERWPAAIRAYAIKLATDGLSPSN